MPEDMHKKLLSHQAEHLGKLPTATMVELNATLLGIPIPDLCSEETLAEWVDPDDWDGDYTDRRTWMREHWIIRMAGILAQPQETMEGQ